MKTILAILALLILPACPTTGSANLAAYARAIDVVGTELRFMSTQVEDPSTAATLVAIADSAVEAERYLMRAHAGEVSRGAAYAAIDGVLVSMSPLIDRAMIDADPDVVLIVRGVRSSIRIALAFLQSTPEPIPEPIAEAVATPEPVLLDPP